MIDAIPLLLAPEGYQISRSVRLRSSASAYFNRTPASAGNRKTFTISFWVKRGQVGIATPQYLFQAGSGTTESTWFGVAYDLDVLSVGTWTTTAGVTTAVFRDPSAWYHVVVAIDTTQATAANRSKIYVNNVLQATGTPTLTLNADLAWNNNVAQYIGTRIDSGPRHYFDGYLTEINFIDGQALTPSSFGETNPVTGVWQPKKYTGTYGTNGFYLNFSDNSAATAAAIGKDYSGNGNNWTPNNISVTAGVTYDSMLDVPTQWADGGNGRGNYCTLNPLKNTASLSNANLQSVNAASSGYYTSYATTAMESGKYYWEISVADDGVNSRYLGIGLADPSIALTGSTTSAFTGTQAGNARGWTQVVRSAVSVAGTGLYNNSSTVNSTTRATTSGTRIFMVAYDANTGKCWMGYEGTWWTGDPAAGTSQYFTATAPMMPVVNPYNDGSIGSFVPNINFGQRPFSYTPPSGFKALNTFNLPEPSIDNGREYMAATTYTGTGANLTITNTAQGFSFQPDFVWVKGRSGATDHALYDSVRGVQLQLESNTTTAETTETTGLTAFNSNGFTVGALAQMNTNTATYVGWQWKKGPTQGFDIVTYTGNSTANRTVAHNLGVTPSMIIVKNRSAVQNWAVAHTSLAANNLLSLDTTGASVSAGTRLLLGNSSTFTVGDAADYGITNQTSQNYVAYLFAEVAGFSRFGRYTGNGSADGPFVFCGFRPRFVMVKRTDAAGNFWTIKDTARNTSNIVNLQLYPNTADAEATAASDVIDIVSNGFKLRGASSDVNASGGTYIFAAFSETSFKYALGR